MASNPTKLGWARTLTGTTLASKSVARDASDFGGVAVKFDNADGVKLLAGLDLATTPPETIDLTKVPGYTDLVAGNHTVSMAEISKNGVVGKYSAPVSFTVDVIPDAPTGVILS